MKKMLLIQALMLIFLSMCYSGFSESSGAADICPGGSATVTISQSGSYILVKDVTMTDAAIDCIHVTANNVTIDLNGHTINGAGTSATLVSGILVEAANTGVRIFNGTIRNFSECGIKALGGYHSIRDINIYECTTGISVGDFAEIKNVKSCLNTNIGISAGTHCLIEKCITNDNSNEGIQCKNSCIVKNCICCSNGDNRTGISIVYGIHADNYSQILNNNCSNNNPSNDSGSVYGIFAPNSQITNNICRVNNSRGDNSISAGIYASDSYISNNNCDHNSSTGGSNGKGVGIMSLGKSVITGNMCNDNSGGTDGYGCGIHFSSNGYLTARDNTCESNSASGANGIAAGIYAVSYASIIENNICVYNKGNSGAKGYGIIETKNNNSIISNTTHSNTTKGIKIDGNTNYYANNIYGAAEDIEITGTGNIAGTGDNANIAH